MTLKRKRSDPEISASSSLFFSSPLSSTSSSSSDAVTVENYHLSKYYPIATPSLFASRTRKRYRDNRPSEEDVHNHTLSMLFSAQRGHPRDEIPARIAAPIERPISSLPGTIPQPSALANHQSSLHSFWKIPSCASSSTRLSSPLCHASPSPSSVSTPPTAVVHMADSLFETLNCEDCDRPLHRGEDAGADAMDVDVMIMMDLDTERSGSGSHACTSCGKMVCHGCAVSNLGQERRCLNCAGRRQVWIGGLGWVGHC